jgi:hypothetical protein
MAAPMGEFSSCIEKCLRPKIGEVAVLGAAFGWGAVLNFGAASLFWQMRLRLRLRSLVVNPRRL